MNYHKRWIKIKNGEYTSLKYKVIHTKVPNPAWILYDGNILVDRFQSVRGARYAAYARHAVEMYPELIELLHKIDDGIQPKNVALKAHKLLEELGEL